ncbi:MAG: TRAP transporter small permease [Candidatus Accumulibacter sp.]|nr:TRAP transporter small permease [Accumulibacter sp.]
MRMFISLYFKLLCVLVTALVGFILVPVTLQVFARYTDFIPTWMWTEEAARFCLIWMIMIGAAIAVKTRGHFDIDILPEPKTMRGKILARLIVDLIVALFAAVFLYVGMTFTWDGRREISEITEMSMILMYIAFPISAFGWLLFLGEQIFDGVREFIEGGRP